MRRCDNRSHVTAEPLKGRLPENVHLPPRPSGSRNPSGSSPHILYPDEGAIVAVDLILKYCVDCIALF
jgi:hypothetical protein